MTTPAMPIIATADELALFQAGPLVRSDGVRKRITAETCIHFLRFDRADYATLGHLIKCNPSIKDASDREALIAGHQPLSPALSPPRGGEGVLAPEGDAKA